jgi:putative salt-induced outer membrane protein YdiY
MKTKSHKNRAGWGSVLLLLCASLARAQDIAQPPADDSQSPETPVITEPQDPPVTTPTNPPVAPPPEEPVVEPDPVEPDEPLLPPVVRPEPPALRGAELLKAFKGSGSSRFGINGRANKIQRKTPRKKEKGEWGRSIEMGLASAQGNSDTLRYDGAIAAARETDDDFYFLKLAGRYGESEAVKDTENITAEAKHQHRLSDRLYHSEDINVLHDRMVDLRYRALGSVSLGRHFIRTERTVLSLEAGPGYVAEHKGGEKDGFLAGRVAQYLEFLITPTLQVWQSFEYVPDLGNSAVFFINAEAGLETVLFGNLSLLIVAEDRYDSNPAEGKQSNDLITSTSLKWKF